MERVKNRAYKRIEENVKPNLNEAINIRKDVNGLILHSDQGHQ